MGLVTDPELNSLMHLIRSPDSHFLKVPELPFHALISVLVKFPADVDSRVFWSSALRDVLFDITFAAVISSQNVVGMGKLVPRKRQNRCRRCLSLQSIVKVCFSTLFLFTSVVSEL